MADWSGYMHRTLDVDAVTIPADAAYHLVATIAHPGRPGRCLIVGKVGEGGDLSGLKLSIAAKSGGQHIDRYVDDEFSGADDILIEAGNSADTAAHQTPAGGAFYIWLIFGSVGEVKLYAKAALETTVALEMGSD